MLAESRDHFSNSFIFASSALTRLNNFGSKPIEAITSLALATGLAGYQKRVVLSGNDFEMPDLAPAITKFPSFMWSATPTWPPNTTFLPNWQLPDIPVCAAIRQ